MTENVHVHGQVRLPEGRPAGGAVVTLLDGQGTQVGYAETAADGGYRVTPRGPGRYLLVAAAPERDPWVGYVTVDAMDVELPVTLPERSATPTPDGAPAARPTSPAAAPSSAAPAAPAPSPAAPAAPSPPAPAAPAPERVEPERRSTGATTAAAAQAALDAVANGRSLSASARYGLVTALLAGRVALETDPGSALGTRLTGPHGGDFAAGRRATDEVLVPLAHQLLSEREGESAARHGRREDAATPENIRAFVRPLIEAMATDMRDRTAT